MKKKPVITIDGPAGAGKSTVSKVLAARLSYIYLDSGALYRAFAYRAKEKGIRPEEDEQLAEMCRSLRIHLQSKDSKLSVWVDGKEVADSVLRSEEISSLASALSARPCVRQALLQIQRKVGAAGGIIAEGRDMGTVVFPDADFKFFLDAKTEERVRRRYEEIRGRNIDGSYAQVAIDLRVRDQQDRERATAPLKPAPDAYLIDSTDMAVNDVVNMMLDLILRHCKNAQ